MPTECKTCQDAHEHPREYSELFGREILNVTVM